MFHIPKTKSFPFLLAWALVIIGSGCAEFQHDYQSEDFLLSRYKGYLDGLEEQGFRFLPPLKEGKKKEGDEEEPKATLDYYAMDRRWDATKISLQTVETTLERIIEDGQDIVDEKTGTYYEYRTKKLKEKGLIPIEQIKAHIAGARDILRKIREQNDSVAGTDLFEDKNIRATFGVMDRFSETLKKSGVEFEPTLDPKKDNLSLNQLRGFVAYRIKKETARGVCLVGCLTQSKDGLLLTPGVNRLALRAEMVDFARKMIVAVGLVKRSIYEDRLVDPEGWRDFDQNRVAEIVSHLFGPFKQPLADSKEPKHLWLKEKLVSLGIYDASEKDPVGQLSKDLISIESRSSGTGLRFPVTSTLRHVAALNLIEAKYRLPGTSDYFLLVRGGARRAKAQLQAVESFFRTEAFLALIPKREDAKKKKKQKKPKLEAKEKK